MSEIRKLLERIDRRTNKVGGFITLKTCSPHQKLNKRELLRICEELEDVVNRDVVALRAAAGLPVAGDGAKR